MNRLPPNVNAAKAEQALKEVLEANPPYNAHIEFKSGGDPCNGWVAPALHEWLEKSLNNASNTFYGKPAAAFGEGNDNIAIVCMKVIDMKQQEALFHSCLYCTVCGLRLNL